jgi:hypothetical protein
MGSCANFAWISLRPWWVQHPALAKVFCLGKVNSFTSCWYWKWSVDFSLSSTFRVVILWRVLRPPVVGGTALIPLPQALELGRTLHYTNTTLSKALESSWGPLHSVNTQCEALPGRLASAVCVGANMTSLCGFSCHRILLHIFLQNPNAVHFIWVTKTSSVFTKAWPCQTHLRGLINTKAAFW